MQTEFTRRSFLVLSESADAGVMCKVSIMSKRNKPKSRFVLEEENGVVTASLIDEFDYSLKQIIHDMSHPRVRAPRRNKEQIEEDSKFMASVHHQTQQEFLRKNINGVNQEINQQVQEIRKSLKRIQSLTHYVVTAKAILEEIEKNT
jgi:hypothetical protein